MCSDRQIELSVFLRHLQLSAEEKTGERVAVHSVTKTDGEKIIEIAIGESLLFAPVVYVEAFGIGYGKNDLGDILQGL